MERETRARREVQEPAGGDTSADVIIVGGGAAGLSAALTLTRAGRRTIVVDAGMPRNRFTEHMHGFLSRDGMPPEDLLDAGRAEAEGYGGIIRRGTVVDATVNAEGTRVEAMLDDGSRLQGRRLLITTGARDELPDIEGLAERWGRDVIHCPYCHGYEVRNQPIGVIATGSFSLHGVHLIRQWSPDVVFFLHDQPVPDAAELERLRARDIQVVEGRVSRLVIDEATDRLAGVELDDGSVIKRTALLIGPRTIVDNPLLLALGVEIEQNEVSSWVVTDKLGQTSVPGVWAAGDVSEPWNQVILAAGAGSLAGGGINMNLVEEDIAIAVASASTQDALTA